MFVLSHKSLISSLRARAKGKIGEILGWDLMARILNFLHLLEYLAKKGLVYWSCWIQKPKEKVLKVSQVLYLIE